MDFSSTKTAAKYCRRCGSLLPKSSAQRQKQIAEMYAAYGESIKFCNECGMPLFPDGTPYNGYSGQPKRQKSETKRKQAYESYNSPRRKRETVYEGVLHRCPNCGELIDAFVAFCPGCGYEIRDAKSATAVSEFASKLEKINAREMPVFVEKRSVLKTIFGRDFQEKDEAREAFERFKSQKEQEIASFIINFSVPNTKEDVTEFIMLAAFNIDFKHGIDDIITTAWISKLNQCYLKAELLFGNDPNFDIIQSVYDKFKKSEKNYKTKRFWSICGPILIVVILFIILLVYINT